MFISSVIINDYLFITSTKVLDKGTGGLNIMFIEKPNKASVVVNEIVIMMLDIKYSFV
jgi:hypothetical protein